MVSQKIKMIAIDLDGTLLRDDCSISDRTKRAVEAAGKAGYFMVPCTGRSYRNAAYVLSGFENLSYFINANGSVITDARSKKILYMETMKLQDVQAVCRILKKYRAFVEIYVNQDVYIDRLSKEVLYECGLLKEYCDQLVHTNRIIEDYDSLLLQEGIKVGKIHILVPTIEARKRLTEEIREIPGLLPISVIPRNIELVNQTWSKWKALEKLADMLGISRECIMAVGDSNNDMEMLANAGYSVAMGNAPDHVKKVCKKVTGTNEEDGVAQVLEALCRNEL